MSLPKPDEDVLSMFDSAHMVLYRLKSSSRATVHPSSSTTVASSLRAYAKTG
jgi:hypothetical protein